ncbi:DUF1624 domain-containing protein [Ottowia testudinis]|uniref:DUF1624 domain-containing protein n=1 Tax=Ottowia testudinis TaxID=2816950 RepID=A0A975CJR5_9BURK|nr:heparan-alpha-glucosaminide N-acetyltransferase [Ottowia testudinis]QTD47106.1 DUF1624 domain-containing protein [Ottowia testudinis]
MASPSRRFAGIDALRGVAMLWMTVYHFCYDLQHFGYVRQNFHEDPVWTWQRTGIVSLFLLCAGAGQAIAVQQGQGWPRFWRRCAQVAGCAALVSLGSWWMFPHSWISFGVLHGMAVMLLITRWLLVRGWLAGVAPWILGLALVLAGPLLSQWLQAHGSPALSAALQGRWLNWLGVVMEKPFTEDWVPLLPWLGVMLWGVGAAHGWAGRPARDAARAPGSAQRALAVLGRWSLSYYMVHQPLLIGLLMAWGAVA